MKDNDPPSRDQACKEYAALSYIVAAGTYLEGANGEYWYPDAENGIDVRARLAALESAALEEGLHFALAQDYKTSLLDAATQEELEAYAKAKKKAEEDAQPIRLVQPNFKCLAEGCTNRVDDGYCSLHNDPPPLEEAALAQMLRQLPMSITITRRETCYIWQCFTANGIAETFIEAMQAALTYLEIVCLEEK